MTNKIHSFRWSGDTLMSTDKTRNKKEKFEEKQNANTNTNTGTNTKAT